MSQEEFDTTLSTSKPSSDASAAASMTALERGDADVDTDDALNHHDDSDYSSIQPTYTGMTLKERRELYGSLYDTDGALWDDIQKYVVDVAVLPTDHQQQPPRKRVKRSLSSLEPGTDTVSTTASTSTTTARAEQPQECNTRSNKSQNEILSQSSSSQKADAAGQSCSSGTTTIAMSNTTASAAATAPASSTTATTTTTAAPANPVSGTTIVAAQPARPQALSTSTDIWGRFPPKEPKDMISCPSCSRPINTLRLASHLDKCMLGKTRG